MDALQKLGDIYFSRSRMRDLSLSAWLSELEEMYVGRDARFDACMEVIASRIKYTHDIYLNT